VSIPTLGPTQPSVKGYRGSFPRGKARLERDADHPPHLVPRSTVSGNYTSSPPKRLRGVLCDIFSFLENYVMSLAEEDCGFIFQFGGTAHILVCLFAEVWTEIFQFFGFVHCDAFLRHVDLVMKPNWIFASEVWSRATFAFLSDQYGRSENQNQGGSRMLSVRKVGSIWQEVDCSVYACSHKRHTFYHGNKGLRSNQWRCSVGIFIVLNLMVSTASKIPEFVSCLYCLTSCPRLRSYVWSAIDMSFMCFIFTTKTHNSEIFITIWSRSSSM
jgi:hypothetical protein